MYEIKVLSNDEFDSLPESETRGANISDSLGFANRGTGRAYVRQTGIHDLNKYLISHELEELESDESTHEDEHGIRHKKFFKELLMPIVTGYNPTKGTWNPLGVANTGGKDTAPQAPQIQGSPFANFSVGGSPASPRMPEYSTGSVGGGLGGGLGQAPDQSGLSPELLQRLRGNYAGRVQF